MTEKHPYDFTQRRRWAGQAGAIATSVSTNHPFDFTQRRRWTGG